MSVLPPRKYSSDEEERLAAALNDLGGKMLSAVDAACRLRTAPGDAKRQRALMKTNLEQSANHGLNALAYSQEPPKEGA